MEREGRCVYLPWPAKIGSIASSVCRGCCAAVVVTGATSASAWTFATTGAPQRAVYNGVSFGEGAGDIFRDGFSLIHTDAKLRDPVSNGRSVYQKTSVWFPTNLQYTGAAQSTGRRSESTWASMKRTTINTTISSGGASASSKVCEDASLQPDICSSTLVKSSL